MLIGRMCLMMKCLFVVGLVIVWVIVVCGLLMRFGLMVVIVGLGCWGGLEVIMMLLIVVKLRKVVVSRVGFLVIFFMCVFCLFW